MKLIKVKDGGVNWTKVMKVVGVVGGAALGWLVTYADDKQQKELIKEAVAKQLQDKN